MNCIKNRKNKLQDAILSKSEALKSMKDLLNALENLIK